MTAEPQTLHLPVEHYQGGIKTICLFGKNLSSSGASASHTIILPPSQAQRSQGTEDQRGSNPDTGQDPPADFLTFICEMVLLIEPVSVRVARGSVYKGLNTGWRETS